MHIKVTMPELFHGTMAEQEATYVAETIMRALCYGSDRGLVVEVTLDPDKPLAQGHYTPHIRIRERKMLGLRREARNAK